MQERPRAGHGADTLLHNLICFAEKLHAQHCWTQQPVLNSSTGCLQAAADLFNEAAAVNPNDARTLLQKGLLERRMGDYEAARRWELPLLLSAPGSIRASLGGCYQACMCIRST